MPSLRKHVLHMLGTVPAISQLSVPSNRINFPFLIDLITVHFYPGCANLVKAYLYLCYDPTVFTTELPPGTNLISELSPHPYILGDNQILTLDVDLPFPLRGVWLKLHLVNDDAWTHDVSAIWSILEHPPEAP